ncbi:hypothetical protein [Arthrobacter castelli]|uniref:hypothetical protein n=1 Tax=Arthrobacter castelli TaxID=271431 RepID=UPI0004084525|nr:hypothetical protein [Arthrobacter castelli]
MQNLLVSMATAEPSPGEDLREGLDPEMVTPGTLGFLATLFVVIAVIFLIRDMTKRIRRVRYREQVQARSEQADADAADGADDERNPGGKSPDGGGTDGGSTTGGGSTDDDGSSNTGAGITTGAGGPAAGTDGGSTERPDHDDESHTQSSNGAGPDRKG